MAIELNTLYKRYCLSDDDVKSLLLEQYGINDLNPSLVLTDEQANFIINSIYGEIENDVDIHHNDFSEDEYDDEDVYDEFDDEDFNWFDSDDDDDDIPDCPPKSQLPYTCGRLSCPYCGQIGSTYIDGTAYCNKCKKWYCYQ